MAQTAIGMSRINLFLISALLLALGSPAGADTVKFYTGVAPGQTYSGPFSGAGTVYDATKSLATDCPGAAGSCPTDQFTNSLSFKPLGVITATAGPDATYKVWDDLAPKFGGMGVGVNQSISDSDQIEGTDVLNISFAGVVKLTGVGTLFYGDHTPFGPYYDTVASVQTALTNTALHGAKPIAFLLSVDGGAFNPVTFAAANTMSLSLLGSVFSFMWMDNACISFNPCVRPYPDYYKKDPTFYVSALTYDVVCGVGGPPCGNTGGEVPIPGALPLFASGLIGLAWLGRRRKRKNAAALAA